MRRVRGFLAAEAGLTHGSYAGALMLAFLTEQLAFRHGGALGAALASVLRLLG